MSRLVLVLTAVLLLGEPGFLSAFDDGPPIAITSPDAGTTFPRAEIKSHSLIWYPKQKKLVACVTFIDNHPNVGQPNDDVHYFNLPGVILDEAKGVFTATSARGEVIPVAKYQKALFIKSIKVLPNANVRIIYPHGEISVMLVALRPDDPALKAPPPKDPNSKSDGMHDVDVKSLLN